MAMAVSSRSGTFGSKPAVIETTAARLGSRSRSLQPRRFCDIVLHSLLAGAALLAGQPGKAVSPNGAGERAASIVEGIFNTPATRSDGPPATRCGPANGPRYAGARPQTAASSAALKRKNATSGEIDKVLTRWRRAAVCG